LLFSLPGGLVMLIGLLILSGTGWNPGTPPRRRVRAASHTITIDSTLHAASASNA